jgi:ATP-binding cassette subfamily F protein 3
MISSYQIPGFPTYLRVMHVEQEVRGTSTSVIEKVLKADVERSILIKDEKKITTAMGKFLSCPV